ncbi:MAG: PKD domain-containing protein, partial [Planctomycetales bacterium]|nr:PKD domain-containing protein [Planctomycetales bacterium]
EGNVNGDFDFIPSVEFGGNASQVVHIEVGVDGALYYTRIGGQVRRVTHSTQNLPVEIVQAESSLSSGSSPLGVSFTVNAVDQENDAISYEWVFGDGSSTSGSLSGGPAQDSHTYMSDGFYQAYVAVSDGNRTVFSTLIPVQVGDGNAAPQIVDFSAAPAFGDPPLEVDFSATLSDVNGDPLEYEMFFGDGTSTGLQAVPAGGVIAESHTYPDDGSYTTYLTVSDGEFTVVSTDIVLSVGATQLPPISDGLVMLLESNIKIGLVDGNTVLSWLDGSGHGNNLLASGDPQLVAGATPGGQPAIVFDGDGDKLERGVADLIDGLPTGNANRSVFLVVNYVDPQSADGGFAYGLSGTSDAFGLAADDSTGNLALLTGANGEFVTATPGAGEGWLTHSVVLSSNFASQYKNGVALQSNAGLLSTDLSDPAARIVIGEDIDGDGYSQISVAAVLVYDRALSETERLQTEAYLNSKYFVGNLPPIANDDDAAVVSGGVAHIGVTANDVDHDGIVNPASLVVVTAPQHGTLAIDPVTAEVTYTHDGSSTTTDSFTYTVDDEVGATSNVATVTIAVGPGTLVTSGLVLQLESDLGVSTGSGGALVASWLDSSGTGNDLQTALGDPTLINAATPSGLPAVEFDGNDGLARLQATDPLNGLPTGAANRTMFLVANYGTASAFAGAAYGSGTFNGAYGLVVNGGAGKLTEQGWGGGNDFVSSQVGTGAGWLVQSSLLSDNTIRHYLDGALIDSDFHEFNTSLNRIVIGQEISGLGYVDIDVAAVLVYDHALSELERLQVEAYLEDKYLTAPDAAPTFETSPEQSIDENSLFVTQLAATPSAGVTFAIAGGADGDLFGLGGTSGDQLQFLNAPDFETPLDADMDNVYEVLVSATNDTGSTTLLINVTVADLAAPSFSIPSSLLVDENQTFIQTLQVVNAQGVTYLLSAVNDGPLFTIGGGANDELQFLSAPDYENPLDGDLDNIYQIVVTATNGEGAASLPLTVTVNDVGAPVFANPAQVAVAEGQSFVQALATVMPVGAAFAISGGDDAASFELAGAQNDQLQFVAAPDFENPSDANADNSYLVNLTATTQEGQATLTLQVDVTDVVEGVCGAPGAPVFCFDAELGVEYDAGTFEVAAWVDQSGQGNDLSSTGTERPIYVAAATPSGMPAIQFDGIDDALNRSGVDGLSGLPAANADRSMFLVARFHDAAAWGGASYGQGAFNKAFGIGVVASGGSEGSVFLQGWGGGNDLISGTKGYVPGTGTTGWMVLSAVHVDDGSDPLANATLFVNGIAVASFNHQYATDVLANASRIVLGEEIANFGNIEIDVAAWMLYDSALDATARADVENYLLGRFVNATGNEAPQFTSPAASTIDENQVDVLVLAADDAEMDPLTFAISGGSDAALFELGGANGDALRFIAAPDFELPGDDNGDNVYALQV